MLSPSAGIDRRLLFDTRPLAEQILLTLQTHPRFPELSAKFAVQLDGGEALAMLEHPHDLWLSAFERDGEVMLAFGLAGCPTDRAAGAVTLENGHALVVAVLELFLERARPEQTRMRHLLDEWPMPAFLEQLRERVAIKAVVARQRTPLAEALHIGVHPQNAADRVYVGAVPRSAVSTRSCCVAPPGWPASTVMAACVSPLAKSVAAEREALRRGASLANTDAIALADRCQ
jgi:precorrin-3B synthase